MGARNWVEKYRTCVQDAKTIESANAPNLYIGKAGAWAFLKLAFLWNYAYYTYTPIVGSRYDNMCYVDLFAGSGLSSFSDGGGNLQYILGSPLLMSTLPSDYVFRTCFFFECKKAPAEALLARLSMLESAGWLTCKDYRLFSDCNKEIDGLINELSKLEHCHFLLFVDPFSTEINWKTMDKLLSLRYPSFDMIFNFQPFGVNRKSYNPETILKFFGDSSKEVSEWKYIRGLLRTKDDNALQTLENYYIQKLKQYTNMIGTIRTIRIRSGKGGFYYDLIYTTRKKNAAWAGGVDHLKRMIEGLTGFDVSIAVDPAFRSLDDVLN